MRRKTTEQDEGLRVRRREAPYRDGEWQSQGQVDSNTEFPGHSGRLIPMDSCILQPLRGLLAIRSWSGPQQ